MKYARNKKEVRQELLCTLTDVNALISSLELEKVINKRKAVEMAPKLLKAYSVKVRILEQLK